MSDEAVANIHEARQKKSKKEKADRKTVIRNFYKAMLHDELLFHWPRFPWSLRVFEDERGARMPIEVYDDNLVRVLTPEALVNKVLQYSEVLILSFGPELGLRVSEAKEVAGLWSANADVIEYGQIAPVRFKSDPGLTWHRLDFDPSEGPFPAFQEMFSRIENADHVMAWIGSLFVKEASRQNYLWLYGTGGQGKSSLSRFLYRLFGRSYRSEMVPDRGATRFWTSGLVGSRLTVFPDIDDPNFVTSSLFKSCTGDDPIRIEEKNESPISINLICKFMFISNDLPRISGGRADTRRIIYSRIRPLPDKTDLISSNVYTNRLYEEREGFIYSCLQKYHILFPDHGDLSSASIETQVGLLDLIQDAEEEFSEIVDTYLNIVDYPDDMPKADRPFVTMSSLRAMVKEQRWDRKTIAAFYGYIERISPKISRFRDKTRSGFYGLTLKQGHQGLDRNDY